MTKSFVSLKLLGRQVLYRDLEVLCQDENVNLLKQVLPVGVKKYTFPFRGVAFNLAVSVSATHTSRILYHFCARVCMIQCFDQVIGKCRHGLWVCG